MAIKRVGENSLTYLLQRFKIALIDKVDKVDGKGLSTNDYTSEDKSKLDGLSNYTLPTASSAVKGGVKVGDGLKIVGEVLQVDNEGIAGSVSWDDIIDKPTIPTVPEISTNIETDSSSDAKTASPKAVKIYVDAKTSSVYKPQGSSAFNALPTLSSSIEGYVYNVNNTFTTTSDFVEGAGHVHSAGTNIVCIKVNSTYKWDVLSGTIDLSAYTPTVDHTELTNLEIDTIWNTVFGA